MIYSGLSKYIIVCNITHIACNTIILHASSTLFLFIIIITNNKSFNLLFGIGNPHLPAPDLIVIQEFFNENNVTAILKYEDLYNESEYGITLNVSIGVTPQVTIVSINGTFELMLLYNTMYNVSSFVSLCGLTGPSTTEELFYGK